MYVLFSLLAAAVFGGSQSEVGVRAAKMFSHTQHDFGMVAQGAVAEYRFQLVNHSAEDFHVTYTLSSSSFVEVAVDKPYLRTYERGSIVVNVNTRAFVGPLAARIRVAFDRPAREEVQLLVRCEVRPEVLVEPDCIDFGFLEQGRGATRRLMVMLVGNTDLRISGAMSRSPYLAAQLSPVSVYDSRVSYEVLIHLDDSTPPGRIHETVTLLTTNPAIPRTAVLVRGEIVGGVQIAPSPLFLGTTEPGAMLTKNLIVKGPRPFRIKTVDGYDHRLHVALPPENFPRRIYVLPVTFEADDEIGEKKWEVRLKTDLNDAVTEVVVFAIVRPGDSAYKP